MYMYNEMPMLRVEAGGPQRKGGLSGGRAGFCIGMLALFILLAGVFTSQPAYAHGLVYDITYKDNTAEVTLKWSDTKDTRGIVPEYFYFENGKALHVGYSLKEGAKKQVVLKIDLAGALPPIRVVPVNTGDRDWTPFKDIKGIEAEDSIRHLHDAGVVEPDKDGKFNPSAPMTRGDFASMLVKALKLKGDAKNTEGVKDIEKNANKKEILLAMQYGYMTAYGDKTFRPGEKLTLGQVCTILSRACSFHTSKNISFQKLKQNQWYTQSVKNMFDAGILNPADGICKNFNEDAVISRADCAIMLSRAITTY